MGHFQKSISELIDLIDVGLVLLKFKASINHQLLAD